MLGKALGSILETLPVLHPWDFQSPGDWWRLGGAGRAGPIKIPLHYLSAGLIELLSLTALLGDLYPPLVLPSLPT